MILKTLSSRSRIIGKGKVAVQLTVVKYVKLDMWVISDRYLVWSVERKCQNIGTPSCPAALVRELAYAGPADEGNQAELHFPV